MRVRYQPLVVILATTWLSVGCSSQLTRPVAAELISKHEFLTVSQSVEIPSGEFCDADMVSYPSGDHFLAAKHQPLLRLMVLGHLKLTAEHFNSFQVGMMMGDAMFGGKPSSQFPTVCRKPRGEGLDYYHWTSTITEAGVAAGIPKSGGQVVTQRRSFVDVTGVASNPDGGTEAEFRWRWDPTKEGQTLGLSEEPLGPFTTTALFRRYDDGWRLTGIKE